MSRTKLMLFYIALLILCIWAGITAGNFIFEMDDRIIADMDTGYYKTLVGNSLPIIDIVYNKGKAVSSFSNELNDLFKNVFGFNPEMPLTILNADSSHFNYYYNMGYLPYINEQRAKARKLEQKIDMPGNEDSLDNEEGLKEEGTDFPDDSNNAYSEAASSISFDEDEEKDIENSKKLSKGSIAILNETNYNIDIDKLLSEPLNLNTDRNGPKVLIFHTHTTESYLQKLEYLERDDVSSWSRDNRYNVVRVGEELAQTLRNKYNIEVIHNDTVHDYPSYNSSYSNSSKTVTSILKSYPSIKVVLDIHRDALGADDSKMRIVEEIEGKKAAKIMFVVGSNSKRLPHPNWMENLKLAARLQQNLNEQYPGLARHIYISGNRYNHHLSTGALIIEIGGDGNTIDESLLSTQYIAKAINEVLNCQ
jgi:stage II sporulation protein P